MLKRKHIFLGLPFDGKLDAVATDCEKPDDPIDTGSHDIEQEVMNPSLKPAWNLGVDHPRNIDGMCSDNQECK